MCASAKTDSQKSNYMDNKDVNNKSLDGQSRVDAGGLAVQRRRQAILECLKKRGFARTSYLSALFSVSDVSIRKDFDFLEQMGLVQRVHGGGQLAENALSTLDLSERYLVNRTAKRQIATKALTLINKPDLCVFIDTGNANLELAQIIPRDLSITIVTNSFSTIGALKGRPRCKVIALGGMVNYKTKVFEGPWPESLLERFSFDLMFLGADGIAAEGFGCMDFAQGEFVRKAITRANTSYMLADASKVNKRVNSVFAKPNEVTAWITDSKVDLEFVDTFRKNQGNAIIAD